MEEEHMALLDGIWKDATRLWGTLRDTSKRCLTSEKAWKQRADGNEDFKGGYRAVLEVKKTMAAGIKALGKIGDIANTPEAKLEKMGIDAVIKELKKHDKIVDKVDAAIVKYRVWYKKLKKEYGMKIKGSTLDMSAFMKSAKRYLEIRGVLNKKLQDFQRMARV